MTALPAPAYTPGMRIYKYNLVSRLGQGQFGEVWRAQDLALNREYAVKILNPGVPVDQRLREAQIGHLLRHNNLVQVHQADVIQHGNDHVVLIAMEYLPAGSIVRRVNPANFLPLPDVLRVAKDILQGLEYLHANSFYHNDIKPENILMGGVGQSMLSDYGIVGVSANGQPVAAPGAYRLHMAPEVISGGNISVTTDIYQAGLTLYRLTTGLTVLRTKQSAIGWTDYYKIVSSGKLVEPDEFPAFIPPAVRRIILRAVALDPNNRFQTALEMRRAIEKLSFPGHWTVDAMGSLIGFSGHHQYRFEKAPIAGGRFNVTAFKRNTQSNNETRMSDFCARDLTAKQADTLINNLIKHVVTGS